MKKFLVLLLVALLGSQMISAQVRSCVTYDSKRDLNGFKQVVLTWKDPFIQSQLWPTYVALINESLKEKGMTIPATLKGMNFILEHTQEYENSYFVQNDYLNGVRIGNNFEFRNVAGNPSNWAVFVYDNVVCMYAKIGCCNPQKPKNKIDNKENLSSVVTRTSSPAPAPTPTVNPASTKKDTIYIVEREIQRDESEQPERSNENTYYINNAAPYGYYGIGYYYGYYGGNYCYRYYGGLAHYYNYGGNYYHSGYTGSYNHSTGSNYNYTGGYNHSTGNYNYTGRYNPTNYGAGYTGRRGGNTTTTTNRGTMTSGRGYQNTGGGRSNISPSYNSRNQTPTSVGRSSTNSFSSRASSTFRSSANTGGGQRGRR